MAARYTLVNLKQVEDMAPKFGYAPNVEARFARKDLELQKSGISYQRLEPNFRFPFAHTHSEQEEVYVVIAGGGRIKVDDDIIDIGRWDAVRVAPGAVRIFESGPEGIELLAFGAPNNESSDIEMLEGWWTDAPPEGSAG